MRWFILSMVLLAGCPVQPEPTPRPVPVIPPEDLPLPYTDPFEEEMADWFAGHFLKCDTCGHGGVCQEALDKHAELWEKHYGGKP